MALYVVLFSRDGQDKNNVATHIFNKSTKSFSMALSRFFYITILSKHVMNKEAKNNYIINFTLTKQQKKPSISLHKSDLDGFVV